MKPIILIILFLFVGQIVGKDLRDPFFLPKIQRSSCANKKEIVLLGIVSRFDKSRFDKSRFDKSRFDKNSALISFSGQVEVVCEGDKIVGYKVELIGLDFVSLKKGLENRKLYLTK